MHETIESDCIAEVRAFHVLLIRMGSRLLDIGESMLAESKLTVSRSRVLGVVLDSPEPLSISDVARQLGLSRQAVLVLARKMETDRLIDCLPDPNGGRSVLLRATKAGRDEHVSANASQIKYFESLSDVLDKEQLGSTLPILQKLAQHIDDYSKRKNKTTSG